MVIPEESFMQEALKLAREAAAEGEVPVGAVVVKDGEIVGRGRNRREKEKNALCHAEVEAIDQACRTLHGWRLWQCELYVTLEPCPMCAGAIINARIPVVVFGAYDPKAGSCGSVVDLFSYPYNHHPQVIGGVLEEPCSQILTRFFQRLRETNGFPHEIGLFLGYPPRDVLAFLGEISAPCLLCGYWKVYFNVEEAKQLFAQYDHCREAYCKAYQEGHTVSQLLSLPLFAA